LITDFHAPRRGYPGTSTKSECSVALRPHLGNAIEAGVARCISTVTAGNFQQEKYGTDWRKKVRRNVN
jgi:hypothetical protein